MLGAEQAWGPTKTFLEGAHLQAVAAQGPELGTQIRSSSWLACEAQINLFCRSWETEALRGKGTYLPQVTQLVVELGFEPLTLRGRLQVCVSPAPHLTMKSMVFCGMLALSHPLSHSLHTIPLDGGAGRLGEGVELDHGLLQGEDDKLESGA